HRTRRDRPRGAAKRLVAARARSLSAGDQRARHFRRGRRSPRLDQARRFGRRRRQHGDRLRPPILGRASGRRGPFAARKRAPCGEACRNGVNAAASGAWSPPFAGIFPIAPTPFTATGELDLAGQKRVLDCMIDQGVDGICILANYSEQFLLSDDERNALLDVCLTQVAGRVPVIVTCSHFSTRIAEERSRVAAAAGAAMLMLMPPYPGMGLRADETGMLEHFARVAAAVP